MLENLRKMLYLGLGAAAMSRDKIRELIDDLEKRGDVTAEEGKKLYAEVTSRAEEQGRAMNERIRTQICDSLKGMGLADRNQIGLLESRFEALERKVNELTASSHKHDTAEG